MEDSGYHLFYKLIELIVLLLLNAFFVASEFSIIRVRTTRIEQLLAEGNRLAKITKKITDDLDTHLAATQLGITVTSLGLGWIGETLISKLFGGTSIHFPLLSSILSFALITFFHITLGEQIPKIISIEKAEKISLFISLPLYWFSRLTYPLTKLIKITTDTLLKIFGIDYKGEYEHHSEEEIKIIVSNSSELDPEDQSLIKNVFGFNDKIVREIMIHRKEMVCIYVQDKWEDSLRIIKESKHTRFPVCEEDRDDVIGYIYIKDLYTSESNEPPSDIRELVRNIPKIYETTPIHKALKLLQKEKQQIAIVLDEYGGVSGLITVEDILEELVGEIQDEFDEELEEMRKIKDGYLVEGSSLIADVEEELGLSFEELDGVDTIGGYVLTKVEGELTEGKEIVNEHYLIRILKVEDNRIKLLKFQNKNLP